MGHWFLDAVPETADEAERRVGPVILLALAVIGLGCVALVLSRALQGFFDTVAVAVVLAGMFLLQHAYDLRQSYHRLKD